MLKKELRRGDEEFKDELTNPPHTAFKKMGFWSKGKLMKRLRARPWVWGTETDSIYERLRGVARLEKTVRFRKV